MKHQKICVQIEGLIILQLSGEEKEISDLKEDLSKIEDIKINTMSI